MCWPIYGKNQRTPDLRKATHFFSGASVVFCGAASPRELLYVSVDWKAQQPARAGKSTMACFKRNTVRVWRSHRGPCTRTHVAVVRGSSAYVLARDSHAKYAVYQSASSCANPLIRILPGLAMGKKSAVLELITEYRISLSLGVPCSVLLLRQDICLYSGSV